MGLFDNLFDFDGNGKLDDDEKAMGFAIGMSILDEEQKKAKEKEELDRWLLSDDDDDNLDDDDDL